MKERERCLIGWNGAVSILPQKSHNIAFIINVHAGRRLLWFDRFYSTLTQYRSYSAKSIY